MYSKDFKTMVMFNGEIYNHADLRKDLQKQGQKFYTSHSDTETLLVGLSYYGINFINKLRGQFAIAFFDEQKFPIQSHRLHLYFGALHKH